MRKEGERREDEMRWREREREREREGGRMRKEGRRGEGG